MFRSVAAAAALLLCVGLAAAQPDRPDPTIEPEDPVEAEPDPTVPADPTIDTEGSAGSGDAAEPGTAGEGEAAAEEGGLDSSAYKAAFDRGRAWLAKSGAVGTDEAVADDIALYLLGNIANTMFHEFGHGLKSELSLPLTGKEEDAVDTFANVIMVSRETDETLDAMIVSVADDYFTNGAFAEEEGGEAPAWDEHSLNEQRAFAVICILVGADPETYKEAADNAGMPPERQQSCQYEYEDALKAWNTLLEPHYLKDGEQQKSKPTITYGEPPAELKTIAGFIKESGIIETVTDELYAMIRMPNDIQIRVEACGEENAYWSPDERQLTFCYEIAQSYLTNATRTGEAQDEQ